LSHGCQSVLVVEHGKPLLEPCHNVCNWVNLHSIDLPTIQDLIWSDAADEFSCCSAQPHHDCCCLLSGLQVCQQQPELEILAPGTETVVLFVFRCPCRWDPVSEVATTASTSSPNAWHHHPQGGAHASKQKQ